MRIFVWLTIAVFISTLFWSQLLNDTGIIYCLVSSLVLFFLPSLRRLAIIPLIAVYFTCYANLTLTGHLPIQVASNNLPFTNATSLQAYVDGQNHDVIVQVNSLINQKNKGYFTAKLIELDNYQLNYAPLLEMRWYNPTVIVQAGQLHRFTVRFKPEYGRANPAGFDRQKWRYSEHIAYQASIKAHLAEISRNISLRARFYEKIQKLTTSLNNQGVILALSFANKTLMTLAQKEQITKLAISHLFAISGLHIGLLFSLLYLLALRLVTVLLPARFLGWYSWRIVNGIALSGALFYAYLAGFSLPTQRAFLMLFFAVLVLSMKRKCALLDLLSLTLLVVLLWDPLAVLSVSLWLSFFAVGIILTILWRFPSLIHPPLERDIKQQFLAIKSYFKFLLLIQLSLTLLMLPMQLMSFSAFSWLSPVINLVAVPLFSLLIIPLILLGCLFSLLVPSLALFCLYCGDQLITLFFAFFSGAQGAYRNYSTTYSLVITLVICLGGVLYFLYYQSRVNRKTSLIFIAFTVLFVGCAFWERNNKLTDTWFVEAFDVGQGLAVLVRSGEQTLLYDSGPRYPSGFTTANAEIVPYLHALGVSKLDYFLISHSDIDHAGGFTEIMDNFMPENVLLGEPLSYKKNETVNYALCKTGQKWTLGILSIKVLSPDKLTKKNNNNSCVVHISDGQSALLLTGDIEKRQEALLIKAQGEGLASDLLFAPHHGSKHSSSVPFIQAVAPQWVVFSAGFMNHWKFPAEEVKLRYKNQSVNMVNSGLSGFIRFKIKKGQIKMQTYREDLASYWYHHSFSL